jgi:hypothetical protein
VCAVSSGFGLVLSGLFVAGLSQLQRDAGAVSKGLRAKVRMVKAMAEELDRTAEANKDLPCQFPNPAAP